MFLHEDRLLGRQAHLPPGEPGVLRAIFEVGKFSGTVDQKISLWLDIDPKNPPTQALKVQIHLPVVVGLEPRALKWETGSTAQAQPIHIRMAEGKPIHVTSIKPSTEQFEVLPVMRTPKDEAFTSYEFVADALCPRREVRRLGCERSHRNCGGSCGARRKARKGKVTEAARKCFEHLAAGEKR